MIRLSGFSGKIKEKLSFFRSKICPITKKVTKNTLKKRAKIDQKLIKINRKALKTKGKMSVSNRNGHFLVDDQELEGVIAHEVGHIIHRDIMLNQLVVALISALLILAFIIERIGIASAFSGGTAPRV